MAIRVAINHKTTYHYDRSVSLSPHIFRLRPAVHSRTPIEAYSLRISPKNHFINWQQDPFGNYQARVVFPEKTTALSIEVEVIANMVVINPFDFFVEEYAEKFPFNYSSVLANELVPYLEIQDNGPRLRQWLTEIDRNKKVNINDFLVGINQKLNRDIAYSIRMEPGVQTCEETLERSLGSCRDSAWLLVQILRHLGLAARFVSGYLVQLTADIKSLDGPSGPENDFTDLHAWAEVYVPGAGWIGLDPTSGLFAGEGHIPLACTPHYVSAAPVVGTTDPCEVRFEFHNTVRRIHEDPRVTKPYSEAQWAAIESLGYQIDVDLEKADVRMTMGGEPTFVSIDDMESPQWNTDADGKEKRVLSHELIFRLREQFGPTGMIHYGQGKWYPGEPLPRWQYGLYWRKDGNPIWHNIDLIAHEKIERKYTHTDAKNFMEELSRHLAINPKNISAAYEDIFFFLWSEGKTPVNIDPLKANLKNSIERRTLAKLLDQGLDVPAGYTLPLKWDYENHKWISCKWELNREYLFLMPGNSPIGLRLPLESLPAMTKAVKPQTVERSLFEELPALGNFREDVISRYGRISEEPFSQVSITEDDKEENITFGIRTIKTALCVEARDGIVYVFIPPMEYLEHYLDIIASIESTAARLQVPVRIEGYEPPRDYRLERLVISPDPGVIEVNIHPSKSWKELLHNTNTLYEQAFLSRLGTEKFMIDGRHTGTGGGNHITIGGATPADSPMLRRPDLLRSLITYWQHHPGLSYLFSGPFIGPTSQAPRIDEGRDERLYEMEIAFSQVPEHGFIPFWMTDRIFRHLLTDITGNTHRSEFCIDKMYSPDSSSGRLGILEFRGFDMPPHKQMSLLQMLLIRGLIAAFWKKPYKRPLIRWGTQLNDQFMLSHYVYEDIKEVVSYLNEAGYPFQMNWFDAYFEFRFPHYGTVRIQGIELEIRMGIEPWHVLGEEVSSTGTARYVDSSLEKVQVKLTGLNGTRYALMCNGVRVPLRETGVKGEYVCGVRFRAWQPPSALHPTIGIDTPLIFDIVDTWNNRSIGGCTYHVAHPGGRSYEVFPVNSYEAESRRISRFWDHGHTQGPIQPTKIIGGATHFVEENHHAFSGTVPEVEINKEYPHTLDLRQYARRNR
ncbi:MAG: transglutaminase family protein [Bacteroidetes bacterium]|nr:transglutaminase family protein [Bacteroidota bacterium]